MADNNDNWRAKSSSVKDMPKKGMNNGNRGGVNNNNNNNSSGGNRYNNNHNNNSNQDDKTGRNDSNNMNSNKGGGRNNASNSNSNNNNNNNNNNNSNNSNNRRNNNNNNNSNNSFRNRNNTTVPNVQTEHQHHQESHQSLPLPPSSISLSSSKPLLILDINGVLIDREPYRPGKQRSYIWRKHCKEFIDFCFSYFDVAVWSCGNAESIEMNIFDNHINDIKFVFSQRESTTLWPRRSVVSTEKPLFLKELDKVWKKYDNVSQTRIILVDNHEEKFERNPLGTCLKIPGFINDKGDDDVLSLDGEFVRLLKELSKSTNIPQTMKDYANEYEAYIPKMHYHPPSQRIDNDKFKTAFYSVFSAAISLRNDNSSNGNTLKSYLDRRDTPGPRSEPFMRRDIDQLKREYNNWVVCEKNNGIRKLLFIPDLIEYPGIYVFDRAWTIEKLNIDDKIVNDMINRSSNKNAYKPTILDGEMIETSTGLKGYIIFDAAFIGGDDIGDEISHSKRMSMIIERLFDISTKVVMGNIDDGIIGDIDNSNSDNRIDDNDTGNNISASASVSASANVGANDSNSNRNDNSTNTNSNAIDYNDMNLFFFVNDNFFFYPKKFNKLSNIKMYEGWIERMKLEDKKNILCIDVMNKKKIEKNLGEVECDGLVFTPINKKYYGYNIKKFKKTEHLTVDFEIVMHGGNNNHNHNNSTSNNNNNNNNNNRLNTIIINGNKYIILQLNRNDVGMLWVDNETEKELLKYRNRNVIIVECVYDTNNGHWLLYKIRDDKVKGNSISTAWKVLESIASNVTIDQLVESFSSLPLSSSSSLSMASMISASVSASSLSNQDGDDNTNINANANANANTPTKRNRNTTDQKVSPQQSIQKSPLQVSASVSSPSSSPPSSQYHSRLHGIKHVSDHYNDKQMKRNAGEEKDENIQCLRKLNNSIKKYFIERTYSTVSIEIHERNFIESFNNRNVPDYLSRKDKFTLQLKQLSKNGMNRNMIQKGMGLTTQSQSKSSNQLNQYHVSTILDIGCGRGGDLFRTIGASLDKSSIFNKRSVLYCGIDVSIVSLNESMKRSQEYKHESKEMVRFVFIECDGGNDNLVDIIRDGCMESMKVLMTELSLSPSPSSSSSSSSSSKSGSIAQIDSTLVNVPISSTSTTTTTGTTGTLTSSTTTTTTAAVTTTTTTTIPISFDRVQSMFALHYLIGSEIECHKFFVKLRKLMSGSTSIASPSSSSSSSLSSNINNINDINNKIEKKFLASFIDSRAISALIENSGKQDGIVFENEVSKVEFIKKKGVNDDNKSDVNNDANTNDNANANTASTVSQSSSKSHFIDDFGNKIIFSLGDAIDQLEEPIIPIDRFVRIAKEYGFECTTLVNFSDFLINSSNDYAFVDSIKSVFRERGLSTHEWDVIKLYLVVEFTFYQ